MSFCCAGSRLRPQARWLCHGGGRKLCEAGRAPVGQPRPCPPQPLPPASPPGSPLPPRLACGCNTWPHSGAPEPGPLALFGSGVSRLASGLLEAGEHAPAKVGLMPRAPASVQNWGPSDLGELLFRPKTVEDSPSCREPLRPGPAACGTPSPRTRPCESSGRAVQALGWCPSLPQPPPGLAGMRLGGRWLTCSGLTAAWRQALAPGGLRVELSGAAVLKSAASWRRRREAAISLSPHVPCSCEQACGKAWGLR